MIKKEFEKLLSEEGNHRAFQYKGYTCQIKRANIEYSGHLCGYIEIPPSHDLYNMEYDDIESKYDYEIPAHGSLTFSGQIGNRFWIGIDCAHFGDMNPCMHPSMPEWIHEGETYKDMEYVQNNLKEIIDYIETSKIIGGVINE